MPSKHRVTSELPLSLLVFKITGVFMFLLGFIYGGLVGQWVRAVCLGLGCGRSVVDRL